MWRFFPQASWKKLRFRVALRGRDKLHKAQAGGEEEGAAGKSFIHSLHSKIGNHLNERYFFIRILAIQPNRW